MKTCPKCKVIKDATCFNKDKNRKDGLYPYCKMCVNLASKTNYKNNSIKRLEQNKLYYSENPLIRRRYMSTSQYKDGHRNYEYKIKYGITIEQYQKLFEKQHGLCAICGKPETRIHRGSVARLSVDHNHETGKVRGLLCNHCNHCLGLVVESKATLRNMITYLDSQ